MTPRRPNRPARHGMVTAMAVTLMVLVGVALAALTARVSTAARQATAAREQAQVEELLLAGIDAARTGTPPRTIELPAALRDAGASLNLAPHGQRVQIEALIGRTRAVQDFDLTTGQAKPLPPPAD